MWNIAPQFNARCMIFRRVSDDKSGVTTEDNPAYQYGSHGRHGETKDEYEYIQSSPVAPQETVNKEAF